MGQVGCKRGKCAASGLQAGQVGCKWARQGKCAASGKVCCKWVRWAASGNLIVPPENCPTRSLPQTVFCVREPAAIFKSSTASCLLAMRLTWVTHFGQHFLPCRLTQSLPQTPFILRETLGKWFQAYTGTCNTVDPLAIHSTHLAHLQHTCPTWPVHLQHTCPTWPTWPTQSTLDTRGPLAPHLPHLT